MSLRNTADKQTCSVVLMLSLHYYCHLCFLLCALTASELVLKVLALVISVMIEIVIVMLK